MKEQLDFPPRFGSGWMLFALYHLKDQAGEKNHFKGKFKTVKHKTSEYSDFFSNE